MAVYDDGAGPKLYIGSSRLYVGGTYNAVGGIPMVNNIASWDSIGWHKLDTGAGGNVYSIAAWDGPGAGPLELYVSGRFFSCGEARSMVPAADRRRAAGATATRWLTSSPTLARTCRRVRASTASP